MTRTLSCLVCAAAVAAAWSVHAQQQIPGTIRSRITLVPVDARVVDRNGNAVTDLTQADFTILEDGKPQPIGHFAVQQLAPDTSAAGNARLELRQPGDAATAAAERRVFLILLGRGRLDVVSRGVQAAIDFVKERALPQDLIAVQAYNRATPFTTDRSLVLGTLQRFQAAHQKIEARLCGKGGLAALYGTPEDLLAKSQKEIDGIFGGAGSGAIRSAVPADPNTRLAAAGIKRDAYEAAQNLLDSTAYLHEASASDPGGPDRLKAIIEAERAFNDFTSRNARSLGDAASLYTAIDYLRFIKGEKHIVYLTEFGIVLPGADDDRGLSRMAADARVAIHPIQTGGYAIGRVSVCDESSRGPMPMRQATQTSSSGPLRSVYDEARGSTDVRRSSAEPMFAALALKGIAEMTGGRASTFRYASEAFGRIDAATRAGYVLGYYPANSNWDGKFRRVEVRVKRPGVTVYHRFGYYGRDQLLPTDERKFMAYTRIAAAANHPRPIEDIRLSVTPSVVRQGQAISVDVRGTIDIRTLTLKQTDGQRTGTIQLVVFVGDSGEAVLGERWQTIDLSLPDETYQKALVQGVGYSLTLPVSAMPRHVKVIVYDQAGDRLGSAPATLEERKR